MNEQWFWQTQGETYGPLLVTELERLERDGKFREGDSVRLGETGEWRPARQVIAGRCDTSHLSSAEPGSIAAACVIAEIDRAAILRSIAGGETGRSRHLLPVLTLLRETIKWVVDRLTALLGFVIERLTSFPGRLATLAVAVVLLGAVLLRFTAATEPSINEIYSEYMTLWAEIRELRARAAPKEEWDELERDATERLAPIIARLEETQRSKPTNTNYWLTSSRSRASIRGELLSAGKNYFPEVLRSGRNKEYSMEERLSDQLSRVAVYLDGDDPYPARKSRRGGAPNAGSEYDHATVGIVAVDALIVAGGFVWWIRRRRS